MSNEPALSHLPAPRPRLWHLPAALLLAVLLLWAFFALWGAPQLAHAAQTGKVIGLVQDGAVEWVAEISPTTGAMITFGVGLPNCCAQVSLNSALDPANGRLYAVMRYLDEGDARIFSFDLTHGSGQGSAPLTTTSGVNYLAYDAVDGQLLGMTYDPAADMLHLVSIDPLTGAFTPLGPGLAGCCGIGALEAAFDSVNRQLSAVLRPSGYTTDTLYTFDVTTGAVISTVALPSSLYAVNHIAYAASTPTLWALVFGRQEAEAQRLATIVTATGEISPVGAGILGCCALLAADVAMDPISETLIVPLSTFGGDPFLATYDLATGAVLYQPPLVGPTVHYVKYYVPVTAPEPPVHLYLPAVLRGE